MRLLRQAEAVCVRDDRSLAELNGLENVHRMPDLAVQEVGFSNARRQPTTGRVGLVIRSLPRFQQYVPRLRALIDLLGERVVLLMQSDVGRGNSDSRFMRDLGLRPQARLKEALADEAVDVVISVRMHGSLETVLTGVPSIHLSYERKGFSAYEDLGIPAWVHHAGRFDPTAVVGQACALIDSPSEYWQRIDSNRHRLQSARAELIDLVRRNLG
jgi:polysaccharide pyruvyl transferase WcaK-like protein